jgi:hypothetical protein
MLLVEIRFGDLHIEHWLAQRLILGVDNLAGFVLVASAQAGSFAGFGVHAIKSPIADAAPDQAVTCFHAIFHATAKINEAKPAALASSGRVTARYPEFLRSTQIGVRFGVRCGRHLL